MRIFCKMIQILELSLIVIVINHILKGSVCVESNKESQQTLEEQYNSYYSELEKLKEIEENDDNSDEPKITLMSVFWPLILTFWWTFVVLIVVLISILCFCVIQACDWTTICKPLEYLPCQGHSILSKRLERLKTPGVYLWKNGIKEYYKPIVNESEIAGDIFQRLQQN